VAEYMREVLYHPVGGFYAARGDTAIGSSGHFITSPEISVLFGEVSSPPLGFPAPILTPSISESHLVYVPDLHTDSACLLASQVNDMYRSLHPERLDRGRGQRKPAGGTGFTSSW
jgi:hypothetical protein